MTINFNKHGCKNCRESWTHPFNESTLNQIGEVNFDRQARLFQCSLCKVYWEEPNGNYPSGITEQDAVKFYDL